jgi:hypothetical protein
MPKRQTSTAEGGKMIRLLVLGILRHLYQKCRKVLCRINLAWFDRFTADDDHDGM